MRRLHVLLIVTHLDPGGAQETVILLAEGLRTYGMEVTVAARPGAEEARVLQSGASVERLRHLYRPISPLRDARAYREIRDLLARERFDVVHTHSSKAGVLGRLAARRAGVPVVVHTSHGLPVTPDMGAAVRALLVRAERLASRACDAVVAVSRATASELVELGIARAEQITVIPSGVDLDRFSVPTEKSAAKRDLGIDPSHLVVGWVGRHFAQKRPELVIETGHRVLEQVPAATLVMAGDGPLLENSRAAAAGHPRISILGHVGDVQTVYAAMDVMLLASAWEGLPRTVLEAQAAGVPVVSTDVSGVREVVLDGVTGFLTEPGDRAALADRVVRLLRDDDLRNKLSAAARARIDDFYSASHTARATAELYEGILSRKTDLARR